MLTVEVSTTPTGQCSAYDAFNQSAGSLTGKSAEIGGVYTGAGSANDFTLDTMNHRAQRTAVSDAAGVGRYVLVGSKLVNVLATLAVSSNNPWESGKENGYLGLVVRYVDVNNWLGLRLYMQNHSGAFNDWALTLEKKVAGVRTVIAENIRTGLHAKFIGAPIASNNVGSSISATLGLLVLSTGEWRVLANGETVKTGVDAQLGSGGALKEGVTGAWDEHTSALAETRSYENLEVWASTPDAAIFASRKGEVRSDRFQREDSAGAVLVPRTDYKGSYFKPQPARREGRSVRTIVKLSRGNVNTMQDVAIDDASFRIYWQARGLGLPES